MATRRQVQAGDRYIQRWLRRLLLIDGSEVRRLTEAEVQSAVRADGTRRKTKRRAVRKRK